MPAQQKSLLALLDAISLDSGELWIPLVEITHADFSEPLRFASKVVEPFVSNGETYQPAHFDLVLSQDEYERPSSASITIGAIDGTLLAALQALDPSPEFEIRVVTEAEPDFVQERRGGLKIARLLVTGVQSMSFELTAGGILGLAFPSRRMTRQNVPGIFQDT